MEEDQTSDTNSRTVAVNRPCLRTLGTFVDARRKLSKIKFHPWQFLSTSSLHSQLSLKSNQTRDLTDNGTEPRP